MAADNAAPVSTVLMLPDEKELRLGRKTTILEASLDSGVPHVHVCGGKARCSTCRVVVVSGLDRCSPRQGAEEKMAGRLNFGPQVRLACQTTVTGDVTVRRTVLDTLDIQLSNQLTPGLRLGSVGEEKNLAILFADIGDYTSFAESLPAYEVIHALRRYFITMGRVIDAHGGRINDYVGDGIMALFGVDDTPDPVYRAVRAGLEMLWEVDSLNPYLQAMYRRTFRIRIGIHYGPVVIGMIGMADMEKMAVIGDAVNVAEKIEDANKQTGTSMLVSDAALREVFGRVRIRETFREVALKGKRTRFTLHDISEIL
jgi:adenylate cyclase